MWFKRFWVLMLSCRATLNFLPFCVTGWVLVSVKVLGWFIKHSLLVFPCSIIWPCLCSIMELAAILISEAGLWLPTCFSAAPVPRLWDFEYFATLRHFWTKLSIGDDYWSSMGFASAEISASHCHRSRFELLQVSSESRSFELWTVSTKKLSLSS